jgi:hypothetical protein
MRMPLRLSLRPPNLAVPSLLSAVGLLLRPAVRVCGIEFLAAFLKRENKREEGKRHERAARQIEKNSLHVYPHFQHKVHNSNF